MSAADRARLGGAATALRAADAGSTRGAALLRALNAAPRRAVKFDDLAAAPDWLTRDADTRQQLGRRAALWAIAPQLAASIDGAWLSGLARAGGDADIDWAIAQATPDQPQIARFAGDDLDAAATAMLRAAAPPTLRDHVGVGDNLPAVPSAVAVAALTAASAA